MHEPSPRADAGVIRVVLVDDHTIVREGLHALLSAEPAIDVVGQAGTGPEAIERIAALAPDVLVIDLGLPDMDGVEVIAHVCARPHAPRILVLSMHAEEEYVRAALRAGASGYLVKGSGLSDFVSAIRTVHRGEEFLDAAIVAARNRGTDRGATTLTPREREVLRLVAEGCSTAITAARLGLSVKTIETHRGHIMRKLDASNVAGLVRHAIRLGLVRG
jgi:DNA-binding NarL/FixJ family response regulator